MMSGGGLYAIDLGIRSWDKNDLGASSIKYSKKEDSRYTWLKQKQWSVIRMKTMMAPVLNP